MGNGIKLIHYTQASNSGAALYVFELTRSLADSGVQVCLICPNDYVHADALRELSNVEVVNLLPTPLSQKGKLSKLRVLLQQSLLGFSLVRKRRGWSPNLQVNFPGLSFFALPIMLLWRFEGFRVILNVHDPLPHRWVLPQPLRGVEHFVLWAMYLLSSRLVVHNNAAKTLLSNTFGTSGGKIDVLPHGHYQLSDSSIAYQPYDEYIALLFGTLRENKGIDLAIEAVQRLRAEGYPLRLLIAGKPYVSEQSYWNRCKTLIEKAPEGIDILEGFIPDNQLPSLIQRCHFFLLPYTEFHSQSGVAALALSNGRAVVATAAGGLEEVLSNAHAGVRIAGPSVEDVQQALVETMNMGHEHLGQLGAAGRVIFLEQYSWSKIAPRYHDLYEQQGGR